jgi:hypothetical protein
LFDGDLSPHTHRDHATSFVMLYLQYMVEGNNTLVPMYSVQIFLTLWMRSVVDRG